MNYMSLFIITYYYLIMFYCSVLPTLLSRHFLTFSKRYTCSKIMYLLPFFVLRRATFCTLRTNEHCLRIKDLRAPTTEHYTPFLEHPQNITPAQPCPFTKHHETVKYWGTSEAYTTLYNYLTLLVRCVIVESVRVKGKKKRVSGEGAAPMGRYKCL